MELKAPDDGFIIEQNVALHETVVDNTTNLFQIAKVDPLIVLAAVPEDDLPALQDLKSQTQNRIGWTVRTVGTEPIAGLVDDIGYLIDPNQHTAVVRGHIPNPDGLLRAGQFVTATVELLPPKNVVEVPISAVVEDGKDSIVFVQTDPKKPVYTMRRVQVTNRFERTAYVRSVPVTKRRGACRGRGWATVLADGAAARRGASSHGRSAGTQDRAGEQAFRDRQTRRAEGSCCNGQSLGRTNLRLSDGSQAHPVVARQSVGRPFAGGRTGRHRGLLFPARQCRGLPRSGPAHRGGRRAVSRRFRRGGGDARSRFRLEVALAGMPGLDIHAQQDRVRAERHQGPLQLRRRVQRSASGDDQSPAIHAAAAAGRDPADFPGVAHGRDFSLRAAGPQRRRRPQHLHAQRSQGVAGLGAGTRVPRRSARGGRYQLGRDHPPLRGAARPDRMRRYGITLAQLQNALANSNATVGGDYVNQGDVALTVRSVGLFGGGEDPVRKVLGMTDPVKAARVLRSEEERRIRDIRALVITSVNNQPVRVEDVVEGGRLAPGERAGEKGVVVGHQTRLGMLAHFKVDDGYESRFLTDHSLSLSQVGHDDPDQVGCIVLLRKGEATLPALKDIEAKVKELNDPASGRMLPGVQIVPYYDRKELTSVTTHTVIENLLIGMGLVTMILLLFLSNVRTALIVAINIPLALLFAFAVLFLRGKSANLLSIGAVDFGIIVDSSVIITENIYRHLAGGEDADLPLKTRILRAAGEIDRALLFSTLIMVCAFIPLFTLQGPAGALFGPMAQTYASALAGALALALMLSPVLCLLLFKNLKPVPGQFLRSLHQAAAI